MKTTKTVMLAITGALALSTTAAARADLLCDHCEYAAPGIYLGGYWRGDRGTFQRSTPTGAPQPGVDDLYVIDIYEAGTFTLAVNNGLAAWIHFDAGVITCTAAGETCQNIAFDQVYKTKSPLPRKASTSITSNRFVMRVRTSEMPAGTTYAGSLSLRK